MPRGNAARSMRLGRDGAGGKEDGAMEFNLILAGVGGQGILTTAQAMCLAAMRRGLSVKQAEVHGMSQRGGAVQSHLRISDGTLYSDLIPRGRANMILAVEPLEALRYVEYLGPDGVIVSNTAPLINIPNYGAVDEVIQRIHRYANHVLVDAGGLAAAAGSTRAVNMVMLGAASIFIELPPDEFFAAIAEMFASKGPQIIKANQRAFELGRGAAAAYREMLASGADPTAVRHWLAEHPDGGRERAALPARILDPAEDLSAEQASRIDEILREAGEDNRRQLYEHEAYRIIETAGGITPPKHFFLRSGQAVTQAMLDELPGHRVVIKIVSPTVVHKSDAQAVIFVAKDMGIVPHEIDQLIVRQQSLGARVDGVLLVECVEHDGAHFGSELFVGIRASRAFGPVIAAGLGGVDTEYLAAKLRPGIAVAKALATQTTAREFLELFKTTAAYEILAGRVRGHPRMVSDGQLLRCFAAFLGIARRFCGIGEGGARRLVELEVNPFAFRRMTMVPLDGRGRLGSIAAPGVPRPVEKVEALVEPRSIAIVGASGKRENFGRIILNNILACGFPAEHLYVLHAEETRIDGVRCVRDVASVPEPVDLLIVAAAVGDVPAFIGDCIDSGRVRSVILIPGGFGETAGSGALQERVQQLIGASRQRADRGPVFLGGNCLGVRSRPGHYDTFFIHDKKLDPRRHARPRRLAFVSQSGAFIVSRLSNLPTLDPTLAISLGNQTDLAVSDLMTHVGRRDDIDVIGVYMEGFKDGDGIAFVEAVRRAAEAGKLVVFYKAGRTEAGRSATAGHTASIAGDYDVCDAAVGAAGAIVVDTFKEFEQVLEMAVRLHGKRVGGVRIGAISNAGFESVGMADATIGMRYRVRLPELSAETTRRLTEALDRHKLAALVNARNPLDLTPMATDAAYEECARALLEDAEIDALIVSMVPLTPALLTGADEIGGEGSIARRLARLAAETAKPIITVIDSGPLFDPLADAIRDGGVPVLRTCDQAIRSLGRYLCHRAPKATAGLVESPKPRPAESARREKAEGLEVVR